MVTHRWRNLGAPSLIGLAVLLNLGAALRPNPLIDLGPIDLTPGTRRIATFRPGYAQPYAIGVRMDRKVAEHLYPCMIAPQTTQAPECKNLASVWPLKLVLKLSSDGHELSNNIDPNRSEAGGEYEGDDTYTWISGYIDLTPNRTYLLDVRSTGRTSLPYSAKPHLVVSAAGALGLLESNAIKQAAALFVGIMLVASAAIWALINSRRREPVAA